MKTAVIYTLCGFALAEEDCIADENVLLQMKLAQKVEDQSGHHFGAPGTGAFFHGMYNNYDPSMMGTGANFAAMYDNYDPSVMGGYGLIQDDTYDPTMMAAGTGAGFDGMYAGDGTYDPMMAAGTGAGYDGMYGGDGSNYDPTMMGTGAGFDGPHYEYSECATDCPTYWIGDGICDEHCLVPECGDGMDGGDCDHVGDCAPDCPASWIGDGICDYHCLVDTCGDGNDGGDCDWQEPEPEDHWEEECAPMCPTWWIGDGICDWHCMVDTCGDGNDGGDCDGMENLDDHMYPETWDDWTPSDYYNSYASYDPANFEFTMPAGTGNYTALLQSKQRYALLQSKTKSRHGWGHVGLTSWR